MPRNIGKRKINIRNMGINKAVKPVEKKEPTIEPDKNSKEIEELEILKNKFDMMVLERNEAIYALSEELEYNNQLDEEVNTLKRSQSVIELKKNTILPTIEEIQEEILEIEEDIAIPHRRFNRDLSISRKGLGLKPPEIFKKYPKPDIFKKPTTPILRKNQSMTNVILQQQTNTAVDRMKELQRQSIERRRKRLEGKK